MSEKLLLVTQSGETYDPMTGFMSKIVEDDIVYALSNLCRFAGHTKKFYSVAEHSLLVSLIAHEKWPMDRATQWAALWHDATEAYVGDLISPIKQLFPEFKQLEEQVAQRIREELKIENTHEINEKVKEADYIALGLESEFLMPKAVHIPKQPKYVHLIKSLLGVSSPRLVRILFKQFITEMRNK